MFLRNLHLSASLIAVLHTLLSIVIGAMVSFLTFIGQNAFVGSTNLRSVLLTGLAGAATYFVANIRVLLTSPQVAQAESDVLNGVQSGLGDLVTRFESLVESHQNLSAVVNSIVQQQAPVQQLTAVPLTSTAGGDVPYQAINTGVYQAVPKS